MLSGRLDRSRRPALRPQGVGGTRHGAPQGSGSGGTFREPVRAGLDRGARHRSRRGGPALRTIPDRVAGPVLGWRHDQAGAHGVRARGRAMEGGIGAHERCAFRESVLSAKSPARIARQPPRTRTSSERQSWTMSGIGVRNPPRHTRGPASRRCATSPSQTKRRCCERSIDPCLGTARSPTTSGNTCWRCRALLREVRRRVTGPRSRPGAF